MARAVRAARESRMWASVVRRVIESRAAPIVAFVALGIAIWTLILMFPPDVGGTISSYPDVRLR
jgi:hypothetical protein